MSPQTLLSISFYVIEELTLNKPSDLSYLASRSLHKECVCTNMITATVYYTPAVYHYKHCWSIRIYFLI